MLLATLWRRIVASFVFALPSCSKILGPTYAMRAAMRANTTMSSSIVKPPWRRGLSCGMFMDCLGSDRNVVDGEHRRKDGQDDEPDDESHRKDHDGLQESQRLADRN